MFDVDSKRTAADALREQTSAPDLWNDGDAARTLLRRLARLDADLNLYDDLAGQHEDLVTLNELAREADDAATESEVRAGVELLRKRIDDLEVLTLLGGEYDDGDAVVSIHAGAGGTESQDWAQMLLRMYTRWAERRDVEIEMIDVQYGDEAGIKSASFFAKGRFAYGFLASEHGVHRLVRISPFDANKRRHTSFAAVDVVPLLDEDVEVDINENDLRIDVYRSSGPGGQSVNTTDSAVRITHLPTGLVVTSQNQRSQLQNKTVAMRVLSARLAELMRQEHAQRIDDLRGERRGIDFGSQIRSYVLAPYQMVKDVRTGEETSAVDAVLDGEIDRFMRSYLEARRLADTSDRS